MTGEGEGEETTSAVTVTRTGGEWASIQYGENGQAYIPSGTKRTDRPATLVSAKRESPDRNCCECSCPGMDRGRCDTVPWKQR